MNFGLALILFGAAFSIDSAEELRPNSIEAMVRIRSSLEKLKSSVEQKDAAGLESLWAAIQNDEFLGKIAEKQTSRNSSWRDLFVGQSQPKVGDDQCSQYLIMIVFELIELAQGYKEMDWDILLFKVYYVFKTAYYAIKCYMHKGAQAAWSSVSAFAQQWKN